MQLQSSFAPVLLLAGYALSAAEPHPVVSVTGNADRSATAIARKGSRGEGRASTGPNIILMMCDDLGWGDTGFNGNRTIRTPQLDAMANAGLRFTRFYAASAVCSPTRGSALTGRHPNRLGIPTANAGHLKPAEDSIAEILHSRGYTTGHFGKWHLGTLTKTREDSNRGGPRGAGHFAPPWINGFDVCFSTEAKVPTYDPMLKPLKGASNKGWHYLSAEDRAQPYGTHYWNERGEIVRDNLRGDDSKVIMDRVVPFVSTAVTDRQPFFAVVWFHAPHLPVVAGRAHSALYSDKDLYTRNYYGCISALDEQVGRLREVLRDLGARNNTMLWFCSDNGPEGKRGTAPGSAGPFRGRKRDLFEGGVRVPALLEWPDKVSPATTSDFPAVTSDYLPTILDVLDIELPSPRPIDGISLLPMIEGRIKTRPKPIGFAFGTKIALTDNQYKIIKIGKGRRASKSQRERSDKFMLFDLIADPGEQNDLAAAHPDLVEKMSQQLQTWLQSCNRSNAGLDD